MPTAAVQLRPVPKASTYETSRAERISEPPRGLSASLTLFAMSLGYGVVQLDVTIVNTALDSIGTSLGGGV
jgi:DHA2 family methylenomycin A resistance protein-like MFS transporter